MFFSNENPLSFSTLNYLADNTTENVDVSVWLSVTTHKQIVFELFKFVYYRSIISGLKNIRSMVSRAFLYIININLLTFMSCKTIFIGILWLPSITFQ